MAGQSAPCEQPLRNLRAQYSLTRMVRQRAPRLRSTGSRAPCAARVATWLVLSGAAACAVLRPEDAAAIEPVGPAPAVEAAFPGARELMAGLDLHGERSLRDGDRVLFGVEVERATGVRCHLLQVCVRRRLFGEDFGVARFVRRDEGRGHIPDRPTRLIDLELTLFDANGRQLESSRIERAMELVFDESFVDGIRGSQRGDPRSEDVAVLRLGEIASLLQSDPILMRLLAEVASIPWDVRLLFRREVSLRSYFERGSEVEAADAAQLGRHWQLPFDLFLNDSLLVRLSATVVDPRGPVGAVAGIVALRAQDATATANQIRLHLLAAARGPSSEWQAHGALATCGYADEAVALAYSPDGRFVAWPGSDHVVELRELHAGDPSVPIRLPGATSVRDVAFLDAGTLLVARRSGIEVFDVSAPPAPGTELRPIAVHAVPSPHGLTPLVLEVVAPATCFVGAAGAQVQRLTFGADRAVGPAVELVREAVSEPLLLAIDGVKQETRSWLHPPCGWLVAGDAADRVVTTLHGRDTEYRRDAGGTWQARELDAVEHISSRRQRVASDRSRMQFDRIGKGVALVCSPDGEGHAFAGPMLSLTGPRGTRILGTRRQGDSTFCHGYSPSGGYYAFVGPGYRVLVDCRRAP